MIFPPTTEEQDQYCRKWLRVFYKAESQLADTRLFSEFYLLAMLKMECKERKRVKVIRRLEARYNKLRRMREREMLCRLTKREVWKDYKQLYLGGGDGSVRTGGSD